MPGRSHTSGTGYRYGFNGKENDNEVKGIGNQQDYGFRIYDTRIARFNSIDPLRSKYPELSTYQFASNSPIGAIDMDGLEAWPITRQWNSFDLKSFSTFTQNEIQRIKQVQATGIGKRLDIEYNCADLAVAIYVRYAAINGLPISFKTTSGKIINSADENQYHIDASNPQKSIDKFEYDARAGTSAASLIYNKDAVNIPFEKTVAGDFNDNKTHTMVVRDPYPDEKTSNDQKAVSFGNLPFGSNDKNDPLWGTKSLVENVYIFEKTQKNFYRFKELKNAPPVENQPIIENCDESCE